MVAYPPVGRRRYTVFEVGEKSKRRINETRSRHSIVMYARVVGLEKQKLWFGVPPNGASEISFGEAFRGKRRAGMLANHRSSLRDAIGSRPDQAPA
jgi:hypothetical protein